MPSESEWGEEEFQGWWEALTESEKIIVRDAIEAMVLMGVQLDTVNALFDMETTVYDDDIQAAQDLHAMWPPDEDDNLLYC